jgi:hypothetical protein
MSTRRSLFGLIQRIHCDRCGERIDHHRAAFCPACASISFEKVRKSELLNDWDQKQTDYKTCCMCRKTFEDSLTYDVCLSCSMRHSDYTHQFLDDRLPPNGTTWAKHCFVCNSVRVVSTSKDGAHSRFRYFRVGSAHSNTTAFRCPRSYPNNQPEIVRSCYHDWIEVASTVGSANEGWRIRSELEVNPVTPIMGLDSIDLDHIAFGETSFWCIKCGNFYILSPNRRHLLPAYGDDRR